MKTTLNEILYTLGITGKYKGYQMIIIAVELALEDEGRLCSVMKELYQPVAYICACPCHCVEHNIRTAIFHAWRMNKEFLFDIAKYPLYAPPSVSEFITILVSYVQRVSV